MNNFLILPESSEKIPFSVRRSTRASSIRLRILRDDSVELVVPECAENMDEAFRFVREKAGWIEKILSGHKRKPLFHENPETPPAKLYFEFTGKTHPVICRPSDAVWTGVKLLDTGEILLSGNFSGWKEAFRAWIVRMASRELIPFAESVRREFPVFPPVSYRTSLQKSRWGSCSSRRVVTLNAALLFFRPEIVRSVAIHEFCHLKEMNHSKRFWKIVTACSPDCRERREELNELARSLPFWLDPKG